MKYYVVSPLIIIIPRLFIKGYQNSLPVELYNTLMS